MCGRFTLVNLAQLTDLFSWVREFPEAPPRYNIAPTQPILAITNENPNRAEFLHWGLIPSWAKDPSIGNRLINARAESLGERNTFKHAYRRRRCLIPADGFYEWKKLDKKTRQPYHVRLKGGKPFALAGVWETWHAPDGSQVRSATIITTDSNELVSQLHDRMPVILAPDAYQRWLDANEKKPEELDELLKAFPAEQMEIQPVSKLVNSAKNEGPELLKPPEKKEPTTLFE